MKYALTFLIAALCMQLSAQQVTIYRTYQRYLSGDGEVYSELVDVKSDGALLKLKKDGEKQEVECKTFWGCMYQNELFRVEPNNFTLMMLVNKGKICYYENGESIMMMMKNGDDKVKISSGFDCCVSLDLEKPLVAVPTPGPQVPKKPFKEFKEANPQLEDLFDCMKDRERMDAIRDCLQKFEGKK